MEAIKLLNLPILEKIQSEKKFYYTFFEDKSSKTIFWINPKYRDELKEEQIRGVFKNATLYKTDKGNYVVRKGRNYLFFIFIKCGYRGGSNINVLSYNTNMAEFCFFHSPKGNLGISTIAVVETPQDFVKFQWKRSGRLYGNPASGISVVYSDGRIETLDNISDKEIEEILTE